MTYQRDPDGRRQGDYIDRDTSIGWAPIVLALAFVVLLGFLMFGSPSGPPSDRPAVTERSEMPNTAPKAPPIPAPAPPKPQ